VAGQLAQAMPSNAEETKILALLFPEEDAAKT